MSLRTAVGQVSVPTAGTRSAAVLPRSSSQRLRCRISRKWFKPTPARTQPRSTPPRTQPGRPPAARPPQLCTPYASCRPPRDQELSEKSVNKSMDPDYVALSAPEALQSNGFSNERG